MHLSLVILCQINRGSNALATEDAYNAMINWPTFWPFSASFVDWNPIQSIQIKWVTPIPTARIYKCNSTATSALKSRFRTNSDCVFLITFDYVWPCLKLLFWQLIAFSNFWDLFWHFFCLSRFANWSLLQMFMLSSLFPLTSFN